MGAGESVRPVQGRESMIGKIVILIILFVAMIAYIYWTNQTVIDIDNRRMQLKYDMGYSQGLTDCNHIWINTISTYGSGGAIP